MSCTADRRQRVRALEQAVECDERVLDTEVPPAKEDPAHLWTVELTLAPCAGGVPPALAREISTRGLTVRDVTPQGLYWRAIVSV